MIPLDTMEVALKNCAVPKNFLSAQELEQFYQIPEQERIKQLETLLQEPIRTDSPVNELYFRSKWEQVFLKAGKTGSFHLLELASGDAGMYASRKYLHSC